MTDNVISLDERRKDEGRFCVSITLYSDGRVALDKDEAELATRAQVAWALANIALGVADLVEYKHTLPDDHP